MIFAIGDRVRATRSCTIGLPVGSCGTVKIIQPDWIGVDWDEPFNNGHYLDGNASRLQSGWNVPANWLELIHTTVPDTIEKAWWCYQDQLGRSPSTREKHAFQAGYQAGLDSLPKEKKRAKSRKKAADAS